MHMEFHFSCSSLSLPPLASLLEALTGHFDGWQIVAEGKHEMQRLAGEFADVAGSYDLKYSVHLPMSDVNIASMNRRIRSTSISEIAEAMRLAAGLGILTFVVHAGTHSVLSSGNGERAFLLAREGVKTLAVLSKSMGAELLVENTPAVSGSVAPTAKLMRSLMAGLPVGLCLDVAHASIGGELSGFQTMQDRIRMVHLSDNDGYSDTHLSIGTGKVARAEILSAISAVGAPVVIEARSMEDAISGKKYVESVQ